MKKQEFEGDLVVVLSADSSGVLTSGGCRVYVKIGEVYEQVGLLQKIKIDANAKKPTVKVEASVYGVWPGLPKRSLQTISRHLKALSKFKGLNLNINHPPKGK